MLHQLVDIHVAIPSGAVNRILIHTMCVPTEYSPTIRRASICETETSAADVSHDVECSAPFDDRGQVEGEEIEIEQQSHGKGVFFHQSTEKNSSNQNHL